MDFTTPRCRRKATFNEMNDDDVNTDEDDNDVSTAAVTSTANDLRPQGSDIARFYCQLATKTPGKPVVLSLVSEYADSYIPTTLTSDFPKPLSELFDASTLELTFDELLIKCEDVYNAFTITRDEAKVVEANTQKQAKRAV